MPELIKQSDFIVPDWPAPAAVRAISTSRRGGASQAPYDQLNLGDHVGDQPEAVATNRDLLRRSLQLANEPLWLQQVHGIDAVDASHATSSCADASYSRAVGQVCVVMTADCLPLLLCDREASVVAAVHAGWRGLVAGVIENTVDKMGIAPDRLLVWLGPAIGPSAFEVGDEVKAAFEAHQSQAAQAFTVSEGGRWLADIYQLARLRLQAIGVEAIYGGEFCTYSESERFYSYRRDGVTGRMASLIWLAN